MNRYSNYGIPILFEQQFDWNVTHRHADRTSVFRVTSAPSLPAALELFGRRCKDAGRITSIRKIGPALVEEQSTQTTVRQAFQRVSEARPPTPHTAQRGYNLTQKVSVEPFD